MPYAARDMNFRRLPPKSRRKQAHADREPALAVAAADAITNRRMDLRTPGTTQ
jgi:hypothetical protein